MEGLMLPTAGPVPTGPGWAHEIKWDGIRVLTQIRRGEVRVWSRNGTDLTTRFPELAELAALRNAVLDGELCVFTGTHPDFGATISRMHARPARARSLAEAAPATFLAFDLLDLNGSNLRSRAYEDRRARLDHLGLRSENAIVPPVFDDGPATVRASLEAGLEGTVSKRLASRYTPGRSRSWVKTRHRALIDAVIVGWVVRPSGGLSLLLAERTPAGLQYVGRCTAPRRLLADLEPIEVRVPPVAVDAPRGVRWARPVVEVEVTASSRTPDGRLRQPRLVRTRLDLR